MKKEISFEEGLTSLELIVKKLESGNVGLDESVKLYKEGIELSRLCEKMLESAKQKTEVIKTENYEKNEFESENITEE